MGFIALLRGGIEVKMVSRSWADFAVCRPIPGAAGSGRSGVCYVVRGVACGACCSAPPLHGVVWRESTGGSTTVSWFVALRARVVVDVLAAENRVAASS